MTNLGPHAPFILSAYGVTFSILGALVAWVVLDHRVQRRKFDELEARGVTRRSARTSA